MKPGYLYIETSQSHPGLVRLAVSNVAPDPAPSIHQDRRIHFVARFNDSTTALMHTHELLKRRLVDRDGRLYRVSMEQAIAAADSLDLKHQATYVDCDLVDEQRATIEELTTAFRRRKQRTNQIFEIMGYVGIALLLFNLFILSWI